jgi:hypothetical protein
MATKPKAVKKPAAKVKVPKQEQYFVGIEIDSTGKILSYEPDTFVFTKKDVLDGEVIIDNSNDAYFLVGKRVTISQNIEIKDYK